VAANGVLVDAGPLVAILSKRDQYHRVCISAAVNVRGPFYTSWPVIAEAAYLLRSRAEKIDKLLTRIRDGKLRLLQLDASDVDGISAILSQYADQDFDFADATLMYLAERERIETVFTVDYRHFSLFRTSQGKSLSLVPANT
jgi:uncharacterized protein